MHTALFGFLKENPVLRAEIVRCLSQGTPIGWKRVALELSTLHNGVITCDWIDDISSGHVTPATQSEAFVTKLVKDDRLNMIVGHFLVACQGAGLENLADRIKERINPNELNAYGY